MKYLSRSIKYFFHFAVIATLIVSALVFLGMADSNIENNFEGGYNAFWKIGLIFAAVSAIYPKVAFVNYKLYIEPSADVEAEMTLFLQERGYVIENKDDQTISFRIKGIGSRILKKCEDRVTITRTSDGYYMEGLRKDVLRLASGLEYKLQNPED